MNAHNIKLITQDGDVTFRGPVRSEDEKNNLLEKAVAVAGKENVTNQLEIAPPEVSWLKTKLFRGETQMANKKAAVFGIYSTRSAVESAADSLVTAVFATSDISVLLPETLGGPRTWGLKRLRKRLKGQRQVRPLEV